MLVTRRRGRRYLNRLRTDSPSRNQWPGVSGYDEGFTILPNGMERGDYLYQTGEYMMYLREQGATLEEIAKRMGVSHQAVHQKLTRHEKERRNMASRLLQFRDALKSMAKKRRRSGR